jgi:ubiquinone/menaquinone biosynthesis C-methylase UbiE
MSAISPTPLSEPSLPSVHEQSSPHLAELTPPKYQNSLSGDAPWEFFAGLTEGIARRWRREVRRRQVGRAYDMALEIARRIPRGARVLDVGCGNGFIAHHLSALLAAPVMGIDVAKSTVAQIKYQEYDGKRFPVTDQSFDAALFCYVLHHAQGLEEIFSELRRTLRVGGLLIVYEDIPEHWWDRIVCRIHNRKWQPRTGPCTFRDDREWRDTFAAEGFELCYTRSLSRWRKIVHPVSRRFFLLRLSACEANL